MFFVRQMQFGHYGERKNLYLCKRNAPKLHKTLSLIICYMVKLLINTFPKSTYYLQFYGDCVLLSQSVVCRYHSLSKSHRLFVCLCVTGITGASRRHINSLLYPHSQRITTHQYPVTTVTENVTLELTIISFASCHHFEKSIIWSVGRVFPFNSLSPDGFFQSLLRVKMPLAKTLHCPSL